MGKTPGIAPPFTCSVFGPDRTCGGNGSSYIYSAPVTPPTGGLSYSWSLSTTTTGGCPGTGTTNPTFCGPSNQPTVCVDPGASAGRYVLTVVVSDGVNQSSCCLSINVTPSTSSSRPPPANVCTGQSQLLCTTSSGTGPFTYSWTKNGVAIPGATDSCYDATAGAPGTVDHYCVTATGSGPCGLPYSTCTFLTSLPNTTATDLADAHACEGSTSQFCTTAGGTGPFTYDWTQNGVAIPGATGSCYTATASAAGTVDTYCVNVTGACGPPVQQCGTLTSDALTTATDREDAAVCEGTTFEFCTTAGGTGPFTYQWSKNGTDIPGATSSCYTATAGAAGEVDEYCVDVTGTCGTVQQCANLRAQANVAATPLTSAAHCSGDTHQFCTTASGLGPFTFSWTKNSVPIAGATINCYIATVGAPGTVDTYCVTVTGSCGPPAVQCATLTSNLDTTATPLTSVSVCAGTTHQFCTTAGGTGPFVYQWKKNGVNIPGANTNCYTATAPAAGQQADLYCVIVSGACNQVQRCATLGGVSCYGSFMTLTQGTYGNAGSQFNGVQTPDLIEALLVGDVTIGATTVNSLTLHANGHDSMCVATFLPPGGMPETLPAFGDETLESDCQTFPTEIPLVNGRFGNGLLGQVITLSLNIKLGDGMTDPNGCTTIPASLATQGICQTMTSRTLLPGPDGCMGTADDVPDLLGPDGDPNTADNLVTIYIPESVITSLNDMTFTSAELTMGQTFGGLLELGNRALAGLSTGTATLDEISLAVDAVNQIFEEGRESADCSHP